MRNASEIKKGQTFTNGSGSTRFEMINIETLLIKNLTTGKESNLTIDSSVYDVKEAVEEKVYVDYNNNIVELTEKEKEFIKALDFEIFEYGTIVYVDTMELTYSTKIARGVLSSLIKKNVCCIHEGMICYSMDKYKD